VFGFQALEPGLPIRLSRPGSPWRQSDVLYSKLAKRVYLRESCKFCNEFANCYRKKKQLKNKIFYWDEGIARSQRLCRLCTRCHASHMAEHMRWHEHMRWFMAEQLEHMRCEEMRLGGCSTGAMCGGTCLAWRFRPGSGQWATSWLEL